MRAQLEQTLRAAGVERIVLLAGAVFDPAQHGVAGTEPAGSGGVLQGVARGSGRLAPRRDRRTTGGGDRVAGMTGSWTLAIDFGTSNTTAALQRGAAPARPVRLSDQADQMPSAVLARGDQLVTGVEAVRSARLDPAAYEANPKRRLGEADLLLGDRDLSGVELAAAVLRTVHGRVDRAVDGQPVREVRLTHPEQWARPRQDLLVRAAEQAGFDADTIRLISEPVAAASSYAASEPVPAGGHVAVFDFGGGTLDVAVLRASGRAGEPFEVVAADGVDPLGGEDLDTHLQGWALHQLRQRGEDTLLAALLDPAELGARLNLRDQVRAAKHALSDYQSAQIPLSVGAERAVITITAGEFDQLIEPDIDAAIELTRRTLRMAGLTSGDLHQLYLTGGSSHLHLVQRRVAELLGRPPATLDDPKLVVCLGALSAPLATGPAWVPAGGAAAFAPPPPGARAAVPPTQPMPALPAQAPAAPLRSDGYHPAAPLRSDGYHPAAPLRSDGYHPAPASISPPSSGYPPWPDQGAAPAAAAPPPVEPRRPRHAGGPGRRRGPVLVLALALLGVAGAGLAYAATRGDGAGGGDGPVAAAGKPSCANLTTDAECGLLGMIPTAFGDPGTCRPTQVPDNDGIDAALVCTVPAASRELSATPGQMLFAYHHTSTGSVRSSLDSIETDESLEDRECQDSTPSSGGWSGGRLLCYVSGGPARAGLVWSYAGVPVHLAARSDTDDLAGLIKWWNDPALDKGLE